MCHDYFILASLSEVKGATLQSPKTPLATFPFWPNKFFSRFIECHLIGACEKLPDRSTPGDVASHNPPNSSPTAWQQLQQAGNKSHNYHLLNTPLLKVIICSKQLSKELSFALSTSLGLFAASLRR